MTLVPGTQVGEYIIVRPLGAGGFGQVYEAREKSTQHRVALKLLHSTRRDADPEKFKREALYANRVRERSQFVPNVVAAGIDANTRSPWLAVEFIDGQTLDAMMEQRRQLGRRWSWGEAREILFCVTDALRAAHANNLVHCDVKPANIIVSRSPTPERTWVAHVLDFGIAQIRSDFAVETTTTRAMSPEWAAPEQFIATQAVTPKSDQFSFAQLVCWLLVGERFPHTEAQRATPTQWARQRGATLPATFDLWFSRATRNAPDERFESVEHAWSALERAFSDEIASQRTIAQPANGYANTEQSPAPPHAATVLSQPTLAVPGLAPMVERAPAKPASQPWIAVVAVVGVAAIVSVGAAVTLRGETDAEPRTTRAPTERPPSPRTNVPQRLQTVEQGYTPVDQNPELQTSLARWSAFASGVDRSNPSAVYQSPVRLRLNGEVTLDAAVSWWRGNERRSETYNPVTEFARYIERPWDSHSDSEECRGLGAVIEVRVPMREQKRQMNNEQRASMPCEDLLAIYTVRFVRRQTGFRVCHENWRTNDLCAECPTASSCR